MDGDSVSLNSEVESDFSRVRRDQVLSALAARVRGASQSARSMEFDEVLDALGRHSVSDLGIREIPLDAIIGSVDRSHDFDRRFRPTSSRSKQRWQRIAKANLKGEAIPPIDVYRLGRYYFVKDGHHRVSVARAMGLAVIDAHVIEVHTFLDPSGLESRADLERKHWRRLFLQRVPIRKPERGEVKVSDPAAYGTLAEMVEAWATRRMHAEHAYMEPREMAQRWFDEEFRVVRELVEEAGVRGADETDADAYIRVSGERYRLIREHNWDREILKLIRAPKR